MMTDEKKRTLLESYTRHGQRLKDIYKFMARDYFAVMDRKDPSGLLRENVEFLDYYGGIRPTPGKQVLRPFNPKRLYDVMNGSFGHPVVHARLLELFRAKGFKGWQAHPVGVEKKQVDAGFFLLRSTSIVNANALLELREFPSSQCMYFDVRKWNGDDFFSLANQNLAPFITRRVVDALQDAGISGWAAEPVIRNEQKNQIFAASKKVSSPVAAPKPAKARAAVTLKASPLDNAIEAFSLKHLASKLRALAQPALLFESAKMNKTAQTVGATRLGGIPDLPKTTPWPAKDGSPLMFIAQFQMRDVAWQFPKGTLPPDGVLSFFAGASGTKDCAVVEDPGDWKVQFFSEKTALSPATLPAGLHPKVLLRRSAVILKPHVSLPDPQDLHSSSLQSACNDIREWWTQQTKRRHRLLGHPDSIQGSVLAQTASDAATTKVAPKKTTWRMLFQMDSDPALGLNWGDCGRLYVLIPEADLANRNFSRCWAVTQTN